MRFHFLIVLIEYIKEDKIAYSNIINDKGWGCGYVLLPHDHPYHGKFYDNIPVEVHGGLTYSEKEGEYWMVGFDTAHYMDNKFNCSKEMVLNETIKLRDQLERVYYE